MTPSHSPVRRTRRYATYAVTLAAAAALVAGIQSFSGPSPVIGEKHLGETQARVDDKELAEGRGESDTEEQKILDRISKMPAGLGGKEKKELAQQLVSSAEHSTLSWREHYGSIENSEDGSGYTGGIIGFSSGTHDMLRLVERYTEQVPDNPLAEYVPALREVDGTDSVKGLGRGFTDAWAAAAEDPRFRAEQRAERDRYYFLPAIRLAKVDGLGPLGQFVYYDAMVLHGPGTGNADFYGIRSKAMKEAETVAEGGKEKPYLEAFLDARVAAMKEKFPGRDTSRVDTAQRVFLDAGNFGLKTPLTWQVYGDTYRVP